MPLSRRFALIALSFVLVAPLALTAQASTRPPLRASIFPEDNWVPEGMTALGSRASFHTDFTFDKQMLGMASGLTGDQETQRLAAKLRSVSVHLFTYSQPGLYDPAALNAVRTEYSERGWQHLSTGRSSAATPHPGRTDLWVRLNHGNMEGMVLLLANAKNVDLILVNGSLSPLDLLHLRGHFGIPRANNDSFGGDRLVPDSR